MLERTLRLGPRDPFRGEWQYRLALAHFGAGRYELARDWSQTAAGTAPALLWPPIHAAALLRLGRREAAQQAFTSICAATRPSRCDKCNSGFLSEPDYGEMRSWLVASLRELGMRD